MVRRGGTWKGAGDIRALSKERVPIAENNIHGKKEGEEV